MFATDKTGGAWLHGPRGCLIVGFFAMFIETDSLIETCSLR